MTTTDPRISRIHQGRQELFVPNVAAWRDILRDGQLDDWSVSAADADLVARWLDAYGKFPAAFLAVVKGHGRWWRVPLIKLDDVFLRVHFENVICQHCNKQCGPSALPDTPSYGGTGLSTAEAWAEFDPFPVKHCPHCDGVLRLRQTVWLAATDETT